MSTRKEREVKLLTEGSIPRHLFRLALPILGASFIEMLYNFTDMAWLGRLDKGSVAAVGAASVFSWLAVSISQVNKIGGEVTVAYAIGEGRDDKARSFASHNLALALLFGATLGLVYSLFGSQLIGFYHLPSDLHAEGRLYLSIISMGLPFSFATGACTGIYIATGHSKIPFVVSGIGLGLNMLLDPLLIFGAGLGSAGAGIATVISQVAVFVAYMVQINYRDRLLGGISPFLRLQRKRIMKILQVGLPVALLNSLFAFINMYLGRVASLTGGHIGVLTLTTGGQLEAISWNTAQGFSTALASFVSQNYGARRFDRVFASFRITLRMTAAFGLGTTLLYFFGGEALFRLIVPDPEAYHSGGIYLRISSYSQIFMILEIATQGFFYGINKSHLPAAISIGGNLLRIPAALFFIGLYPTVETLWWVISASSILKGIVAYACYHWQRLRFISRQSLLSKSS